MRDEDAEARRGVRANAARLALLLRSDSDAAAREGFESLAGVLSTAADAAAELGSATDAGHEAAAAHLHSTMGWVIRAIGGLPSAPVGSA